MSQPRETARDDPRDETEFERLDRNTVELLNEPRIAATGVQVMFAFLLIVPFNARWNRVGPFDRGDYFVTLVCVAAAAALLIAPSIHYRVLFRAGEKPYLVKVSNRCAIADGSFLAVGLTGILVLLTHVLFGAVAGALTGIAVFCLWFALPLRRRVRPAGGAGQ
jgi:O-antigen/teichoic acid export membrane protein